MVKLRWFGVAGTAALMWGLSGEVVAQSSQGVVASEPSVHLAPKTAFAAPPPPIWFWGVGQRDCETDDALSAAVYEQLSRLQEGQPSWPMERLTRAGNTLSGALPACGGAESLAGAGCAQALSGWCPELGGWLLGGRISQVSDPSGERAMRTRLWLYDVRQQRRIVQDDYCQVCRLERAELIAVHAHALLQAAQTGRSWEPLSHSRRDEEILAQPGYCIAPSGSSPPKPPLYVLWPEAPGDPIASLQVDSIKVALRGQLGSAQRLAPREIPYALDKQKTAVNTLSAYLDRQSPADWQIVVLAPDGGSPGQTGRTYSLGLYNRGSQAAEHLSLGCKDSCAAQLEGTRDVLSRFLGRCFGAQCARTQDARYRPAAACLPFPRAPCPLLPLPPPTYARKPPPRVEKQLAGRLLGLGWGAASLPLVGALVLGIADRAGVTLPNRSEPDRPIVGALQPAILATAGVGTGLAVLAAVQTAWLAPSFRARAADVGPAVTPLLVCPATP